MLLLNQHQITTKEKRQHDKKTDLPKSLPHKNLPKVINLSTQVWFNHQPTLLQKEVGTDIWIHILTF